MFLLPPEVVLTEDKVGEMAGETTGLEDFHLLERRGEYAHLSDIFFFFFTYVPNDASFEMCSLLNIVFFLFLEELRNNFFTQQASGSMH